MGEKIILLEAINPLDIYGIHDANLELIKKVFPKLKIVARGDTIKVLGDDDEINQFEEKLNLLIEHYNTYNQLTENDIEHLMTDGVEKKLTANEDHNDVLVFGPDGIAVKARSANQRKMVESYNKNDIVFAIGPAGTGKTYTAVALAVRSLKNKEVRRIILTRPAVEAGENLGFLPGDLKEKLDPYLRPLYDALQDMIPYPKLKSFIDNGIIEIAPLAFMRGRTLDNAVVLLDEAQNTTIGQLKMLLTRMGKTAKVIVTGDITQIDLPKAQPSGLIKVEKLLSGIKGIDFIYLDENDVVRHDLVRKIIVAFNK
ncbi:PhoH family protein [bacterium AH-315-M05]|nr:PhoH family protein [bacterium AH-315-M05]